MNKEILRYIFWEWIEPIGSALCIALLVMKFVMAIYVIPTGSMQPTLYGQNDYGSGDKVLVNKFVYRFGEPKRWDVIVFQYPYKILICKRCNRDIDRGRIPREESRDIPQNERCEECNGRDRLGYIERDYIKRCVAVPGDELTIQDGNILLKQEDGSWAYSIKSKEAQDALWVKEFFLEEDLQRKGGHWIWQGQRGELAQQGKALQFKDGSVFLYSHSTIIKGLGDKGPNPKPKEVKNPILIGLVGDLKLEFEIESWPSKGNLELEISRNNIAHKAKIDFASKKVQLFVGDETKPFEEINLKKAEGKVSWARVDGQVVFTCGEQSVSKTIPNEDPTQETSSVYPRIKMQGGEIVLKEFKLYRDIYYSKDSSPFLYEENAGSYKLKEGEYFAMGDNSHYSADSREWGPVKNRYLIGKALGAVWLNLKTWEFRSKLIY